ncbi:DNA modification methylase [Microbacterium sp.]|uniref:DNA modification methylase n=1 Tax=Microbacterium sp. TaxID=51671 RepID=UPI003A92531E
MKSRLFASVAVSAAVILGATGCSMISPQGTTIPYSPGDGINVAAVQGAPLEVRNALIVATDDGSTGNLIAGVINMTSEPHTLTIQIGEGTSKTTLQLQVPANSVSSLGENVDPLRIDGLDVKPGATVQAYFQSGSVNGAIANVPVLGGNDEYLSSYVPQPLPSPANTPS